MIWRPPNHSYWLHLNRNPPLPLKGVHIQKLLPHFSLLHGPRRLQKPIRKSALPMVYVGNNYKIPNIHMLPWSTPLEVRRRGRLPIHLRIGLLTGSIWAIMTKFRISFSISLLFFTASSPRKSPHR